MVDPSIPLIDRIVIFPDTERTLETFGIERFEHHATELGSPYDPFYILHFLVKYSTHDNEPESYLYESKHYIRTDHETRKNYVVWERYD